MRQAVSDSNAGLSSREMSALALLQDQAQARFCDLPVRVGRGTMAALVAKGLVEVVDASLGEHCFHYRWRLIADDDSSRVKIHKKRPWNNARLIVLIGPGGAGKTTLSRNLAPVLRRVPIDLDQEFCDRNGRIDEYIRSNGYLAYKKSNSMLAKSLMEESSGPLIFVTSSGFLTLDNPPDVLSENIVLVAKGYSISLLPHADFNIASNIIVNRQLARGLYEDAAEQRRTIQERFELYRSTGDMLVTSSAPPSTIAKAIAAELLPANGL